MSQNMISGMIEEQSTNIETRSERLLINMIKQSTFSSMELTCH